MRWILWCGLLAVNPVILGSCNPLPPQAAETVAAKSPSSGSPVLWTGSFSKNWLAEWGTRDSGSWGLQNMAIAPDPTGKFPRVLRVRYPAGSASPAASRKTDAATGGAQFYATLKLPPQDALRLSYYVRFSKDFDFVKGGKLPGLFGGSGNSGGDIPDGTDGFSTRFMWRRSGDGEVYAYLPTSKKYGTSIGRGNWRFQPGVWHHLEQEVILNQPQQRNGRIRVWFDGKLVLTQDRLVFRRIEPLKIEGLFFSTFFGGSDASWASPKDVYADFANFSVSAVNPNQTD